MCECISFFWVGSLSTSPNLFTRSLSFRTIFFSHPKLHISVALRACVIYAFSIYIYLDLFHFSCAEYFFSTFACLLVLPFCLVISCAHMCKYWIYAWFRTDKWEKWRWKIHTFHIKRKICKDAEEAENVYEMRVVYVKYKHSHIRSFIRLLALSHSLTHPHTPPLLRHTR